MVVLISVCGVLIVLVALVGYLYPPVRNADSALPDFDARPIEALQPG
jgi:hypothetical protein